MKTGQDNVCIHVMLQLQQETVRLRAFTGQQGRELTSMKREVERLEVILAPFSDPGIGGTTSPPLVTDNIFQFESMLELGKK